MLIKDLEISNASDSDIWIDIPKVYTKEEIAVDNEDIATPAKLKQWNYLQRIIGKITQDSSIKVEMLIGANCIKALEPLEVIPSQEDGPYAFRTLLGWCIVGPVMDEKQTNVLGCHKIAVEDIGTDKIGTHT